MMRIKFLSRRIAVAAIALTLGAHAALAQSLFKNASPEEVAAASSAVKPTPITGRRQVVNVDVGVLDQNVAPSDAEQAPENQRLQRAIALPGLIALDLFQAAPVSFRRQRVEAPGEGGFVWYGMSADTHASAILVVRGTRITGVVHQGAQTFSITPAGGTVHVIAEERTERLPRDLHPTMPKIKNALPALAAPPSEALKYVDVLVAFTQKAQAASVNIQDEIRLAISMTNQAFINSGIGMRFRLVGTMLARRPNGAAYNEDAVSYDTNLRDLTFNTPLAGVRTKRNAVGADLVALIRESGQYCGIAWAPTTASPSNEAYGFSVTSRGGCILGNTFAHETGHNMGLLHDRFVHPPAGNDVYYYGYVDTVGAFRDIMSYSDACVSAGVNCTRVPYFSTPLKFYNGRRLGKAQGQAGAADGARSLRENAATIAGYRTPRRAAPARDTTDDIDENAAVAAR